MMELRTKRKRKIEEEEPAVKKKSSALPYRGYKDSDDHLYTKKQVDELIATFMPYLPKYELYSLIYNHNLPPDNPIRLPPDELQSSKKMLLWPRHLRNVRRVDFDACRNEISKYDDRSNQTTEESSSNMNPFLRHKLVEPIVDKLEEFLLPFKHKLRPDNHLKSILTYFSRQGEVFVDQLLEVLLVSNAKALQGEEINLPQVCWTKRPFDNRPVANWNFVKETIVIPCEKENKNASHKVSSSIEHCNFMNLQQSTLNRIKKRLKLVDHQKHFNKTKQLKKYQEMLEIKLKAKTCNIDRDKHIIETKSRDLDSDEDIETISNERDNDEEIEAAIKILTNMAQSFNRESQ